MFSRYVRLGTLTGSRGSSGDDQWVNHAMKINFTFITVAYLKPGCYFIRIYMHTRHHFLFLSIISHFRSGNPLTLLEAKVLAHSSRASAVHCLAEDKRYKFPCHHSKSQPARLPARWLVVGGGGGKSFDLEPREKLPGKRRR